MNEEWRDIPGYEGRYQVSNAGRVKSVRRFVRSVNPYSRKEFMHVVHECILRPGRYCKSGHLSVVLGHGLAGKPVHQLVARAFLGEPAPGMEVLHRNGDPTDNRLCNLRYGTRTENILDVYRQGKRWRRLSTDDVSVIRTRLAAGEMGVQIARDFGVSQSTISSIKLRRTFGWLK